MTTPGAVHLRADRRSVHRDNLVQRVVLGSGVDLRISFHTGHHDCWRACVRRSGGTNTGNFTLPRVWAKIVADKRV